MFHLDAVKRIRACVADFILAVVYRGLQKHIFLRFTVRCLDSQSTSVLLCLTLLCFMFSIIVLSFVMFKKSKLSQKKSRNLARSVMIGLINNMDERLDILVDEKSFHVNGETESNNNRICF